MIEYWVEDFGGLAMRARLPNKVTPSRDVWAKIPVYTHEAKFLETSWLGIYWHCRRLENLINGQEKHSALALYRGEP